MFVHSFESDATLDHVACMQDLDQIGALTFERVATAFVGELRDEETIEVDVPSSQERLELGTLFAFVLKSLLDLEKENIRLYREPILLK